MMERLLKKRDGIQYQIDVIYDYLTSISTATPGAVKTSAKTLESKKNALNIYRERYEQLFDELCEEADSDKLEDVKEGYKHFQTKYTKASDIIEEILDNFFTDSTEVGAKSQETNIIEAMKELVSAQMESFQKCTLLHQESLKEIVSSQSKGESEVGTKSEVDTKLPKLDLKSFSGGYVQWSEFYDLFKCAVDSRKNLAPVQKFQYLKSVLDGEAANLVKNLNLNDSNYSIALTLLKNRYENVKNIREAHFDTIFNLSVFWRKSSSNLRKLHSVMNENLQALENIGEPVEHWDSLMVYICKKKLDAETRFEWEKHTAKISNPTFKQMLDFISEHAFAIEASEEKCRKTFKSNNVKSFNATQANSGCFICFETDHRMPFCPQYTCLSSQDRKAKVLSLKLCLNCLSRQHFVAQCPKPASCRLCKRKHHPTLHFDEHSSDRSDRSTNVEHFATVSTFLGQPSTATEVLLATAIVHAHSYADRKVVCRVLLDPGSQVSFVSRGFLQRLRLKGKALSKGIMVNGIGGVTKGALDQVAQIKLSSSYTNNAVVIDALVIDTITSIVPGRSIGRINWPELDDLQLADQQFLTSGPIDILLGADVYPKVIVSGSKTLKSPNGEMLAQPTIFGWVITGSAKLALEKPDEERHILTHFVKIDQLLKRVWEIEDSPSTDCWSLEEKDCDKHFKETTYREDGRYVVSLPFKNNCNLGESRSEAFKRFQQLEKRLSHDQKLKQEYSKVINEYFDLNHAEKVPDKDLHLPNAYYMPHHCVIRESSSTTKVRVVFNASAKTSNGMSLNDCLMVGPKVQEDLVDILIRFRMHPIAFSADIAKMYRQVMINPLDRDFHRFFWRENSNEDVKEYRMKTVTFGVASSAFHAQRVLIQLANDKASKYPLASPIVKRDMYMDDCLSGAQNIDIAIKTQGEINDLLSEGGFELRKWSSNSIELLKALPKELCDMKIDLDLDLEYSDHMTTTLGMHFFPIKDEFFFKVQPIEITSGIFTKRLFLSDTSRIFDPLGLLAPVLITTKILFQKLWLRGLSWDDPLPDDLLSSWMEWRTELLKLQNLRFPRCLVPKNTEIRRYELHGFCDASEAAFAAVVYLRTIDSTGWVLVNLISAKTKVAPLKKVSLPRLELCGAQLLARLMTRIKDAFTLPELYLFAWTDSMVTLSWIRGEPSKWKTFVGNRVSEIQDLINPSNWRYCPSKDNPADCASRGIKCSELLDHALWYSGPLWLKDSIETWPSIPNNISSEREIAKELRSNFIGAVTISQNVEKSVFALFPYSSFSKVVRVLAWCLRWKSRRSSDKPVNGHLTTKELNNALLLLIKEAQKEAFASEIEILKKHHMLPRKSNLLQLNPFVDDDDILRVGGRLNLGSLPYSSKHQILLPKKHVLTNLIIDYEHKKNLHAGPQLLLATIQQRYWIIGGRGIIRRLVHNCVKCRRCKADTLQQIMGPLPADRIRPKRAFLNTGVDYAGPVLLKTGRGRGTRNEKAWLALFICLSVKAIHIELVSSLSTDAFLAAFKRFTSRRGKPQTVYSDHGTNFIGANRELRELSQLLMSQKHNDQVLFYTQSDDIEWHFMPPKGSHFGGLWEAGVKSVKYHLRRIIGNVSLTFEEMTTVLCQIEACLNSRPLTPMSSDPSDLQALTPGHFLISAPLNALPEHDVTDIKVNRLNRWQHLQLLHQHFWKRWSSEYLSRLQQRPKWMTKKRNLVVNDLVILKEENTPPTKWIMGRVEQLHIGSDGNCRVVTLRTAEGVVKRPIVKLVLLLSDEQLESSK